VDVNCARERDQKRQERAHVPSNRAWAVVDQPDHPYELHTGSASRL
jgi:hypothetical protein